MLGIFSFWVMPGIKFKEDSLFEFWLTMNYDRDDLILPRNV